MTKTTSAEPLPLGDTLRDLALLRAADVDLSSCLPDTVDGSEDADNTKESVTRSYEFVREARSALRILNRGEVDKQGSKVDEIRNGFEDIIKGLEPERGD